MCNSRLRKQEPHFVCVLTCTVLFLCQGFFFWCPPVCSFYVTMFVSDARTDIRNNENKLALEMATNAQCASLLKRKQGSSKYSCHWGAASQHCITWSGHTPIQGTE